MSTAPPAIRDFARRLVAAEVARADPRGAAGRVCEGLRVPLAKLAGDAGFRSLFARAAALARAELPPPVAEAAPGRSPADLDEIGPEAGVVVVAHLIGLLVTFIGEPLTLGLVREAWPQETLTGIDASSGEGS